MATDTTRAGDSASEIPLGAAKSASWKLHLIDAVLVGMLTGFAGSAAKSLIWPTQTQEQARELSRGVGRISLSAAVGYFLIASRRSRRRGGP